MKDTIAITCATEHTIVNFYITSRLLDCNFLTRLFFKDSSEDKWRRCRSSFQQISESPLTDHEKVHVQRNEAKSEKVGSQPSVKTPLSGEKPSQVKVRRPRERRPAWQFAAGNEAPRVESNQLLSDPASDKATTSTKQPESGTMVPRSSEVKSSSEFELAEAKSPLNNVLSDAFARQEASTMGDEVYGADECPVEKRPSRNVKMPKK